ncbi:hypothetical protein Rsub_09005 [Raphidocelis subcapitata]|uniref:Uncharacterized protein n=1 Tax=Raphidocelis subcapitata TaxID=307507 RepID=A0A2V0PIP8_9CHLO|nr:hypothetical protein Rsub_09005 [Raphidocelis subcapitata]|eukprot:GBF96925.1 hypothetical protein Rsub_09005 [Raphidocelis subcapitata]
MALRSPLPALLLLALLAAAGPCASARGLLQQQGDGGGDIGNGPPAIPSPGEIVGALLRQILSLLSIRQPLADALSFELPPQDGAQDTATTTDSTSSDPASADGATTTDAQTSASEDPAMSAADGAADGSNAAGADGSGSADGSDSEPDSDGDDGSEPDSDAGSQPAADGSADAGPPGPPPRPGVILGRAIRDVLNGVSGADGSGPGMRQAAVAGPNPTLEFEFGPEMSLVPGLSITGAEFNPATTLGAKGLALTLANNLGLEGALQPQGSFTKSASVEAPSASKTVKVPGTSLTVEGGENSQTVTAASGKADAGAFANGLTAAVAAAKAKAAAP